MFEPDPDAPASLDRPHATFVPTADRVEIVVAVSASDSPHTALSWVAQHATVEATDVMLVTVLESGDDRPRELDRTLARLNTARLRLEDENPAIRAHIKVREGDVLEQLLVSSGDLIVVGADDRADQVGERDSLALRLAMRSDRPVVVVPAAWRSKAGGDVIVAVAPDMASDTAVDFAAAVASHRGCELRLVHVGSGDPSRLLEQAGIRARQHGASQVRAEATVGHVAEQLLQAASGAHLLVLGRPHRSAAGRLVLGSVARDVLDGSAKTPVAIVPVREGLTS